MRHFLETAALAGYLIGAGEREDAGETLVDVPVGDFLALIEEVAEARVNVRRAKELDVQPHSVQICCGAASIIIGYTNSEDASRAFRQLHSLVLRGMK